MRAIFPKRKAVWRKPKSLALEEKRAALRIAHIALGADDAGTQRTLISMGQALRRLKKKEWEEHC